jgi:uncharacterized protein (DUF58 family)
MPVASPALGSCARLTAAGALAALLLGRPAVAALVAPFALAAAAGLALGAALPAAVAAAPERERVLEGETFAVNLTLRAARAVPWLEVHLALPRGLEPAGPAAFPVALSLPPGSERHLRLAVRARRWGAYRLGDLHLRARGPLGMLVLERRVALDRGVRVLPGREQLRRMVAPARTQAATGSLRSRERGEGIEPADLRPYVPGDRVRRINWRATARRGVPIVTDRHPERNADVVLFLDTFAEARRGYEGTLAAAVRAADALAAAYLERRDRVGLVAFGGVVHWLTPGAGSGRLERIVDALLMSEVVFSYAFKDVTVLPARTLPTHALVVALTPLLDERTVGALADLRGRGHDVVIVEVSPEPFVEAPRGREATLARRLWRARRAALRGRFAALGVPVAAWDPRAPLAGPLEEVMAWRRFARRSLRA